MRESNRRRESGHGGPMSAAGGLERAEQEAPPRKAIPAKISFEPLNWIKYANLQPAGT